jgi:hypothetical protein
MTMYLVTIQFEHGCKLEFVETTILRAAARVEGYREHMMFCDIQLIKEDGKDGDQESS